MAERPPIVDEFQKQKLQVLVCGIGAAGESITLTTAATTLFVELDWVPAALAQAEDRTHRVGQARTCRAIYFTARTELGKSTVDAILLNVIEEKLALIEQVLLDDVRLQRVREERLES